MPYLAEDCLDITEYDEESPNAGQMRDGTIRRDRIIIRNKIIVTPNEDKFLSSEEVATLMRAIRPQYVSVKFKMPYHNEVMTREFYCSSRGVKVFRESKSKILYRLKPFNLIEQGVPGYA